MRRLFRAFERGRVEVLLISGQASVLYGASQFSEDVDLWVRPTSDNLGRLRRALARAGCRVYKLTPPLTLRHARRGHDFHFTSPRAEIGFVDVMAAPPRVGPFGPAARRARRIRCAWGQIPVVSPEDLVLLKRTRRPADYDVISNLVRLRFEEDPSTRAWAVRNTFDPRDLLEFLKTAPRGWRAPSRAAVRALRRGLPSLAPCRRALALEMSRLQTRDEEYWRPIIHDLRRLRCAGLLLQEGAPVGLV